MCPIDVVWIYILLSPRSDDLLQTEIRILYKKFSKYSHALKMDFSLLIKEYKRDFNSGKNKSLRCEILIVLCKSCFTFIVEVALEQKGAHF